MKYLKLYESFKEEIEKICHNYGIWRININKDGTVDVDSGVNLYGFKLNKLPIKFGKIYGDFNCAFNQLSSLIGSPNEIIGYFHCYDNELTTLIGGPKKVIDGYRAESNLLKDVYGFPEYFNGDAYVDDNPVYEIIELVDRKTQEVKFIKWLNEYDVIRDGNKIVEMRLEEAYWMATKKELPLNCRDFKNYQLI